MAMPKINLEELNFVKSQGFSDALSKSSIVKVDKNTQFITLEESVDEIWILLHGEVRALQEYSSGEILSFRTFSSGDIFGEMELLSELDTFRASLITKTECVLLCVPIADFSKYLGAHTDFLLRRTKLILRRELADHQATRVFLMIKAIDRIKIYLVRNYEISCKSDVCYLKITRKQIHEDTGYAVRTVNRVFKKLEQEHYLEIVGHSIRIDHQQYLTMKADIDDLISF